MPIYEYNGKRYNIPEAKIEELVTRMPGAKLIEEIGRASCRERV